MVLVNIFKSGVMSMSSNNNEDKSNHWENVLASVLSLLLVIVLNGLFGEYLWNNVLKRLVPVVGKARWYDTLALQLLLILIIPSNL